MRRKIEEERWDGDAILHMKGTPPKPDPLGPGTDIPIRINVEVDNPGLEPQEVRPPRQDAEPRRVYLLPKDFKMHGYTDDCEGCRRLRAGKMSTRPHSAACRKRIEKILEETGDSRWMKAQERHEDANWKAIGR